MQNCSQTKSRETKSWKPEAESQKKPKARNQKPEAKNQKPEAKANLKKNDPPNSSRNFNVTCLLVVKLRTCYLQPVTSFRFSTERYITNQDAPQIFLFGKAANSFHRFASNLDLHGLSSGTCCDFFELRSIQLEAHAPSSATSKSIIYFKSCHDRA